MQVSALFTYSLKVIKLVTATDTLLILGKIYSEEFKSNVFKII